MAALAYNIISIEDRRMSTEEARQKSKQWFDYRRALRRTLGAEAYVVLEVLEDHANEEGWSWPSYATISEETNIKRTRVYQAIKELKALNLVETKEQPGKVTQYKAINKETVSASIIEGITHSYSERVSKPIQNMNPTHSEYEPVPVQNMNPNVSHVNDTHERLTQDTIVSCAAEAASQEKNISRRFIDQLRDEYQEAQNGNGPLKHKSRDSAQVIGKAFESTFARPPNYPRLQALAGPKYLNSGWELIKIILSCSSKDIGDDPHDYLQQVIEGKQNGSRNRLGTGRTGTATKGGYSPNEQPAGGSGQGVANPAIAAKYDRFFSKQQT